MSSSGILRRVALRRTDDSEERSAHTLFLCSVRRLLVTANAVPSSPILVTLMMEALSSSETSVLTKATWRYISEDGILHSHGREKLKILQGIVTCAKLKTTPWRRMEEGYIGPRFVYLGRGCRWVLFTSFGVSRIPHGFYVCEMFYG
jgi:hypothetical protein